MINLRSILILLLSFLSIPESPAVEELKIGVLAISGPPAVHAEVGETAWHLTRTSGRTVTIVPLGFPECNDAVVERKVHFLLTNTGMFVQHEQKSAIKAVATIIYLVNDRPFTNFGGVIFAKAERAINSLKDMKGAQYAVVEFFSVGARCKLAK